MAHYILRSLIISLIVAPAYLLIKKPWKSRDKREILMTIFTVYIICLLVFTLEGDYAPPGQMIATLRDRLVTRQGISLKPFNTIGGFLDWGTATDVWINIVANVLIFVPMGLMLPLLYDRFKKPYVILPFCLFAPVCIECWQLFINRHTDIDDVILNLAGGVMGYIIYLVVNRIMNKSTDNS